MPVNDSSGELNSAATGPEVADQVSAPRRTASDYLALGIATWGVGYLPVAPGTWGSLVGVAIFMGLGWFTMGPTNATGPGGTIGLHSQVGFVLLTLSAILVVTLFGIWAASQTERLLGRKDPGQVVVDEVAGQMISLLPLCFLSAWPPRVWVLISFLLFRFFDIVKPYPARQLEGLRGGLGVMLDDLAAGAYGALVTATLIKLIRG